MVFIFRGKPQDEVKAYQTRFANTKPKGIPGLAPPVEEAPKKKEQKPKPAKAEKPSSSEDPDLSKLKISDPVPIQPAEEKPAVVDIDKKIKGLKKKLRDIEEILKKDQSQLNPEQLEKISKKSQIEEEIRNLEASK